MKKTILFLSFLIIAVTIRSQTFSWGKSYGSSSSDEPNSAVVDGTGNIYTTGSFGGTVDFDPGPGTFTLTAVGQDVFITKFDTWGNFIWAKQMGGAGTDIGFSIGLDGAGNIYTSGRFQGVGEFDPGPMTYTLTSVQSGYDLFISKLDAAGNFVWAKNIGGTNGMISITTSVDPAGNIYASGTYQGTTDFDPGPGTYTITSSSTVVFALKLDISGDFVWATKFGNGNIINSNIKHDVSGNVIIVGRFFGTMDFDPGPATYTLSGNTSSIGDYNGFITKLDPAGNFSWAKQMGNTNTDIEVNDLAIDATGNVYSTGSFNSTCDFDLGPGTYTITATSSGYDQNAFILKMDASGNFLWVSRIGGTTNIGNRITNDLSGYIYSTGVISGNSLFFNPVSGASYSLTGSGTYLLKINPAGSVIWGGNMQAAISYGKGIGTDNDGNIYSVGRFSPTGIDLDPAAATSYTVSGNGSFDVFIQKNCAVLPVTVTGNTSVCAGQSITLTAGGVTAYSWSTGAATSSVVVSPTALTVYTVTGSSSLGCSSTHTVSVSVNNLPNVTISGTPTLCAGQSRTLTAGGASTYSWSTGVNTAAIVVSPASATIYTVTGTSSAGCVNTKTVNITVNALPVISISGNTLVCQGKNTALTGSGITSYTWNTGAQTASINSIITASTSFTLNGKDASGCAGLPAIVTVSVNPAPVITASNGAICSGQSFTLSPVGASTYTYSGGSAVVSPASSSNYTISGTGSNGCTGTLVVNVTVNALPNVGINSNTVVLCTGNTAILSANGAVTYTWNTGATTSSIVVSPGTTTSYTVTGTNSNGCKRSSAFTQTVSTCQVGIEQLVATDVGIKVFPNPAQHTLVIGYTIEKPSYVSIFITDALGKEVKAVFTGTQVPSGTYDHHEDISDLNNGLYFVKIRIDHTEYTVKLVKMN